MASDEFGQLAQIVSRFDQRKNEEPAHRQWERSLARRDEAMANPVKKSFVMPPERPRAPTGAHDRPGHG